MSARQPTQLLNPIPEMWADTEGVNTEAIDPQSSKNSKPRASSAPYTLNLKPKA